MTSMYECDVPGCDWRNPNWRYGFAEAGATWAEHAADHSRDAEDERTVGMCTSCGAIEVYLNKATGRRDFAGIGESAEYPTGYGCELCA